MVKLYLIFIDIIVPIILGFFVTSLVTNGHLLPYVVFGLVVVMYSIVKGFYEKYYSIHFSEKIKISFATSSVSIFVQLSYYSYYSIDIDLFIVASWVLIPIIILTLRYVFKRISKSINDVTISIIGNLYKFDHLEIEILKNKKFKINFYDDLNHYLSDSVAKPEISKLAVINLSSVTAQDNNVLSSINSISLGKFMENYLRKVYIDDKTSDNDINKYSKSDMLFKRLIDFIAIIVLFPVLILTSIYVIFAKFLNGYGGSFIYLQERYGKSQNIFLLFKFRTMHRDSDSQGNTTINDKRIYPFANVLRKFRLDELPQIINIIFGDMHLVGPRAEWIKLSDEYSKKIDNYYLRNIVRPGLTGWAQVLYQYGFDVKDSKQKLMYELYYIKNWTVWLELEICIKTILVILDKKGF
mgnify:CR=1 FL=1